MKLFVFIALALSMSFSPAVLRGETRLPQPTPAGDPFAPNVGPGPAQGLTYAQKLGGDLPLDASFVDHDGKQVHLSDYFGKGPVILAPAYYRCKNICTVTIRETFQAIQALRFKSQEAFTLVFFSIDPKEGPEISGPKRRSYLTSYKRSDMAANTHFLTGDEADIKRLTDAIGFQFRYDVGSRQYVHPAGIVIATPAGKISRYLMGIHYEPLDLRLGLVEASDGKIGTPVDKALLFCYKYDPAQGKYGFMIMSVLRLFGGVTVTAMGGFIFGMIRRERRKKKNKENESVR